MPRPGLCTGGGIGAANALVPSDPAAALDLTKARPWTDHTHWLAALATAATFARQQDVLYRWVAQAMTGFGRAAEMRGGSRSRMVARQPVQRRRLARLDWAMSDANTTSIRVIL